MAGGLIVLVVLLAVASAAGWGIRLRNGRFKAARATSLTEDDLGAALGERATLVQFSTGVLAAVSSVLDAAPRRVESDSGAARE